MASECATLGEARSAFKEDGKKDSDDDDAIDASIQRVIAQASLTDEDSVDALLLRAPIAKKKEAGEVRSAGEETAALSAFGIAAECAKVSGLEMILFGVNVGENWCFLGFFLGFGDEFWII